MGTTRETRFSDRIAERYAKGPVADEAGDQRKLEVTREFLPPDMEVPEVGCGTGSTAIAGSARGGVTPRTARIIPTGCPLDSWAARRRSS